MYAMYMKSYTAAEFRSLMREALNLVEAGEEVHIVRHGKTFKIEATKTSTRELASGTTDFDTSPDWGA